MADVPRSSFIPKEAGGMIPGKIRRKHTFHVFGFLASIALIGSLISAGFVYFLGSAAEGKLEDAKQLLSSQKDIFNVDDVAEVREFDRRLQAAEQILNNHISPLKIFGALEQITKNRVQFTSFSLDYAPAVGVEVDLRGKTPEFKTLAQQQMVFEDNDLLKDVTFRELTVATEEGVPGEGSVASPGAQFVDFSLSGTVDVSHMLYTGQLSSVSGVFFEDEEGNLSILENEGDFVLESVTPTEL